MKPRVPITRRRLLLGAACLPLVGLLSRPATARDLVAPKLLEQIEKLYALGPDQDFRRIAPPYPPVRLDYYRAANRFQAERIPEGPDTIYFLSEGGKLRQWGMTFGQTDFRDLMERYLKVYPQEVEGDAELLAKPLPGDYVARAGAKPENLLRQVEQVLREEFRLPARVAQREVERKVYVARGRYEYKPLAGREKDRIEIYGHELTDPRTGGGGSGNFVECLQWVGRFIEGRIVNEVAAPPQGEVSWHYNQRSPSTEESRAQDRDPASVLRNFTAQTGITFAEETRKVRVVFLERA